MESLRNQSGGSSAMDYRNDIPYPAEPVSLDSCELHPLEDLLLYAREYAREKPEMVAIACLGLGFILGWKLKPW
jgi:hypothetical protein